MQKVLTRAPKTDSYSQDCPVKFELDRATKKVTHQYMSNIPPMGECDVKFTRWARMLGDLIAHSVDGDFLPIALMEHERLLNAGKSPPSIAIFRMEYNMEKAESRAQVNSSKPKKRDREGKQVSLKAVGGKILVLDSGGERVSVAGSGAAGPKVNASSSTHRRRSMEYVSIPLLFHVMEQAMIQSGGRSSIPEAHSSNLMRILASLIALTGTDFTRKLPQITPRRVWDLVPVKTVWGALLESYDPQTGQLKVDETCDKFVAALYALKFCNHVPPPGGAAGGSTLQSVIGAIRRSRLSDKTKSQIPDFARVEATVRNSNWVLRYWDCIQPQPAAVPAAESETSAADSREVWDYGRCFPDPVSQEFGFKASKNRKNAVQWMDVDE